MHPFGYREIAGWSKLSPALPLSQKQLSEMRSQHLPVKQMDSKDLKTPYALNLAVAYYFNWSKN